MYGKHFVIRLSTFDTSVLTDALYDRRAVKQNSLKLPTKICIFPTKKVLYVYIQLWPHQL